MLRPLIVVALALLPSSAVAQPSPFSLPAPGRLLVVSAEGGGVWVVHADGSRRRLGIYEDAQWSPSGRFVVASRRNALLALTPTGAPRWSLARGNVYAPVWGGAGADTRIAYAARSGLRIVGGDGRGDRLLAPAESGPFAWRPGAGHQLAYLSASELRLQDTDSGRVVWRAGAGSPWARLGLSWSGDGQRLLVVFERELLVFGADGRRVRRIGFPRSDVVTAAFAPAGPTIAVLRREPGVIRRTTRSFLDVLDADGGRGRRLFAGRGDFGELAWSPNGRFVLLGSRFDDRWLFVDRASGKTRAVAAISTRFPRAARSGERPADLLLFSGRWCCAD